MASFIIFALSLALLALLFLMKGFELSRGRKILPEKLFCRCDAWIHRTMERVRFWWSHVTFQNTHRVMVWILAKAKMAIITIKRRFDHKQSHFFVKREARDQTKNRGSVSFFLKNVSDYKKTLREGQEE